MVPPSPAPLNPPATKGDGVSICAISTVGTSAAQEKPFVCSITQTVECDDESGCGPPLSTLVVPTFLHVDVEQGAITILGPAERRGESTPIQASDLQDDNLILTGIEAGRAFSMVIAQGDGSMSLTIADAHVGFVVFGQCITSDELSP